MNHRTRSSIWLWLAVGVVTIWCAGRFNKLAAQSETRPTAVAYQYVGVGQSIARIDTRTGAIEILSVRDDARASLLTPGRRPWSWRLIRLRRDDSADRGRSGGEAPEAGD